MANTDHSCQHILIICIKVIVRKFPKGSLALTKRNVERETYPASQCQAISAHHIKCDTASAPPLPMTGAGLHI